MPYRSASPSSATEHTANGARRSRVPPHSLHREPPPRRSHRRALRHQAAPCTAITIGP
ncbi:hypothetical protein Dimus_031702, partial [Dionaea muscipula]